MSDETLSEQTYRQIKQRIVQGEMHASDTLTERALAERSGISRTPLRSALSRLEKEGVIFRLANGALMIREVTVEQLLEICETRRLLEGLAAERAAGRARGGLSPALIAAQQEMTGIAAGGATSREAFARADEAFHRAVAAAAGFALLGAMIGEMHETAQRSAIARRDTGFADQARDHLAVIAAIAAGDGPAARAAMEQHFDALSARFVALLLRRDAQ